MSQLTEGRTKTFTAGEPIGEHILARLNSSGLLEVCQLGEVPVSVMYTPAFAAGQPCAVTLVSADGTFKCIAAGAFSQGAVVYGRADGKVDDISTTSAIRVGIALEAATNSGDVIEVMPS
jgi:hypothetical protein